MSRASSPSPIPFEPAERPDNLVILRTPPRRSGSRGLVWIAVAAALAAAGGYAWRARQARAAKAVPVVVRSVKVAPGTVLDLVRLTGVTVARDAAGLTAPQLYGSRSTHGGHGDFNLVLQSLAPSGSFINKGDLVASFDPLYMTLRLDDHRSILAMHEAYMRVLTAQFGVRRKWQQQRVEVAKGTVEKAALNLKTAPVRSAIQTELFRLQYEEAKARHKELVSQWEFFDASERSGIRRLELDIKEQSLGLKRAQRNLDRMSVHAPISGILVMQTIYRGGQLSEVQTGDQVYPGHLFAQIVDQRSMVVNAEVNQVDAEKLRPGQSAKVQFDAFPDLELPAHVVSIGMFANASGFRRSFVKTIPVRLSLDGTDSRVIPNFTVSADVVTGSEEAEAVVPRESVFTDSAGAEPYVFVRGEEGWEKREVELGLENHVAVAVRDGLQPGEVVAAERPSGK